MLQIDHSVLVYEKLMIVQKYFYRHNVPNWYIYSFREESVCISYKIAHFSTAHFQKSFPLLLVCYSVSEMYGPNLFILSLHKYYSFWLCSVFSLGVSYQIPSGVESDITSGRPIQRLPLSDTWPRSFSVLMWYPFPPCYLHPD